MYKHILVPVLLDGVHDPSAALDVANLLADEGAKITLLSVVETIPVHTQVYLPDDFMDNRQKKISAELLELAKKVPGGVAVVIDGHAGRSILDWAADNRPDCIVIAGHEPGMQDLLLGSTASKVVRHAKCSVHVTR